MRWPRPNADKKQPGAKNSYNDNKPFSKLQRDIYKLLDENLDLQIQCRVTQTGLSNHDGLVNYDVNYWVTLGRGDDQKELFHTKNLPDLVYAYASYDKKRVIEKISQNIREYILTPKEELLTKTFEDDECGFVYILRCSDRRVGRRSKDNLLALILTSNSHSDIKDACTLILNQRFS